MDKYKIITAIDPGRSGGIAVRWSDGNITAKKMPDTPYALYEELLLSGTEKSAVYIERIPKTIGFNRPASAMSVLFENYGLCQGISIALKARVELIRPQEWMKRFSAVRGKRSQSEWKRYLKDIASRIYPDLKVTLNTADALLLLDYAIDRENKRNS